MNSLKNIPGAYWFGISYESDLAFADRLYGKTKLRYIATVRQAWGIDLPTERPEAKKKAVRGANNRGEAEQGKQS